MKKEEVIEYSKFIEIITKELEELESFQEYKRKYPNYKFYGIYTISTNLIDVGRFDPFIPMELINENKIYYNNFFNTEITGKTQLYYVYLIPND